MTNNHYVPQFYLRNFEIINPPPPIPKNHVYSYKRGFSPKPFPIGSVASEIGFDEISEGEKAQYSKIYNKLLKETENSSPSIISNIIHNSTFSISDVDKKVLAWFIALLATRTPTAHQYFVKDIMNSQEKINERVKKDCVNNEQEIHKILKQNNPQITGEEIDEFKKFTLETDFNSFWKFSKNDNNKSYIRSLGAIQAESVVNDLLVKNWHLLIITGEEVFITSDNPVSFLFPRLVGIRNQIHTESPVFLPLSPKKALYIHPYSFCQKTLSLDKNQVDYFVKETVKHAGECVYSNSKSEKFQEILNATPFNLSNLNYKFNFPPYEQIKAFWTSAYKHFAETRTDN